MDLDPARPSRGRSLESAAGGRFRAHARRSVRLVARITHLQSGWQRQAPVENVGLGGACVALGARLEVGEAVTLTLTAPTLWEPLVVRARVAWAGVARPPAAAGAHGTVPRVGLAFEHRGADAVLALYELILTLGYD